jgi:hypothetical protein
MIARRHLLIYGVAAGAGLAATTSSAQSIGDILRGVAGSKSGGIRIGDLSRGEIDTGLREALTVGTGAVIARLGRTDGYFADGKVRIPLPSPFSGIQRSLKRVGLSAPLDDLQLRINRGAETAAPRAKDLFLSAIRSITIDDAVSILRGGDTAATSFLRQRTEPDLTRLFQPLLVQALDGSGAMASFESAVNRYGRGLVTGDLRGQLASFATEKALNGVFLYLADEEKAIRQDPVRRSSDILRRVFGAR